MKLIPFYDRIELVNAAIHTVRDALIEGLCWWSSSSFSSWAMSVVPLL